MTSQEIRQSYLDFFSSKKHTIVPSAPMVVKNDPTLMFTNAGMNQFKDIFLGHSQAKHHRIADSQKCLRVSGKHNDLEEVGHDTYHHTMFEMLGNWSFGDYFKKEAIAWAWEYLTEVLHIEKDRLYVTVFEGSKEDQLDMDTEALEYWKQFLSEDRILFGNKKDNFWEMGDTGPCGPCSEIHYDSRPEEEIRKIPGNKLVNASDPQVIEIWNLVFMQYNRKASGELEKLPASHVDTGMGFERLCRVIQHKNSNYDIDLFQDLLKAVGNLCGKQYGSSETTDIAMRVIADHLRAISFSIADGQIPSNNRGGYVIRRLLRRAVRYGYTFLGLEEPFLYALVPALIRVMGEAYPELISQQNLIERVIKEEETSFLRTLSTGLRMLDGIISKNQAEGHQKISGSIVFELYDTYGFPLDLTELILRERGMTYNEQEYQQSMQEQKARSRADASVDTGDWIVNFPSEESVFVGYDTLETQIKITKYRQVTIKGKSQFQLVFDVTPFYAESGGQSGDSGIIVSEKETIRILDTHKENNLNIHLAEKLPADMFGVFVAKVDLAKRHSTESNHTATHLLHNALRTVLGTHVEQKGSAVNDSSLRFDFSHFQKVTGEELKKTERLVNAMIRKNFQRQEWRDLPIEEARKKGAMALFGEKYGDKVRMISYGDSLELCGGTHVPATGNIGFFKILYETSVAAGIRRIEAVTGERAEKFVEDLLESMEILKQMFNNTPSLTTSVKKTLEENESLRSRVENLLKEQMVRVKEDLYKHVQILGKVNYIESRVEILPEVVKDIAFQLRQECSNTVFVSACVIEGKPNIAIMVSNDLVDQGMDAVKLIREAAKFIQGGGGGQSFYATAGGKNAEGISKALQYIKETITQ